MSHVTGPSERRFFKYQVSTKADVPQLPTEVLDLIVRKLDESGRAKAAKISHAWRGATIERARMDASQKIKIASSLISQKLDPKKYARLLQDLKELTAPTNTILQSTSLIAIKENLKNTQITLSSKLQEISDEDFTELLADLFEEEKGEQALVLARARDAKMQYPAVVAKVVIALCDRERFDVAAKAIHLIEDESQQTVLFQTVAMKLIETNRDLNELVDSTKTLPQKAQSAILSLFALRFSNELQYAKALEIADRLPDKDFQQIIRRAVISDLVEREEIGEALMQTRLLLNDEERVSVVVLLLDGEHWEEASALAKEIKDDHFKSYALVRITNRLSEHEDFDEAITLAQTIPEEAEKSGALAKIASDLLEKGLSDRAEEVQNMVTQKPPFQRGILHFRTSQDSLHQMSKDMVSFLCKYDLFDDATAIADMSGDEESREELLNIVEKYRED